MADDEVEALLEFTLENEHRFKAASVNKGRVGSSVEVDPERRIALTLHKIGPIGEMLRPRLLASLEKIAAAIGTRVPRSVDLELELAAHGDGAHFEAHRDIPVGPDRVPLSNRPGKDRVVSGVYYFYREPKRFSGGELRLFRFGCDPKSSGADPANHIDLQPVRNSFVAFPSWVTHEVKSVSCPSGQFADYRFGLNCWYLTALQSTTAPPAMV